MLTNIEGQISNGLLYTYMHSIHTCKKDTNKKQQQQQQDNPGYK